MACKTPPVAAEAKARCSTARGRNIPYSVVIQMLAESANRCAAPDCDQMLWVNVDGGVAVRIAEIAHILPASSSGPRADDSATEASLISATNLIVLCPNSHTVVDKAPDVFTAELLREWKVRHQMRLDAVFGVCEYRDRASARFALEAPLEENREIWRHYGPESSAAARPDSEAFGVWKSRVLDTVIPNNHAICRTLETNRALLTADERSTLRAFRRHAASFAARHLAGEFDPTHAVFPSEMDRILTEEEA